MSKVGGRRVGSGPKPSRPISVRRLAGAVVSRQPPDDLPVDQREFWSRYAQHAIDAQTLTLQTVAAWRLLCELESEMRATRKIVDADGRTYEKVTIDGAGQEHREIKAHPLVTAYRQLAQRVEQMMGRFGLAPFGKPVVLIKHASSETNPWAQVGGH